MWLTKINRQLKQPSSGTGSWKRDRCPLGKQGPPSRAQLSSSHWGRGRNSPRPPALLRRLGQRHPWQEPQEQRGHVGLPAPGFGGRLLRRAGGGPFRAFKEGSAQGVNAGAGGWGGGRKACSTWTDRRRQRWGEDTGEPGDPERCAALAGAPPGAARQPSTALRSPSRGRCPELRLSSRGSVARLPGASEQRAA